MRPVSRKSSTSARRKQRDRLPRVHFLPIAALRARNEPRAPSRNRHLLRYNRHKHSFLSLAHVLCPPRNRFCSILRNASVQKSAGFGGHSATSSKRWGILPSYAAIFFRRPDRACLVSRRPTIERRWNGPSPPTPLPEGEGRLEPSASKPASYIVGRTCQKPEWLRPACSLRAEWVFLLP